jgi:hypothetical protein
MDGLIGSGGGTCDGLDCLSGEREREREREGKKDYQMRKTCRVLLDLKRCGMLPQDVIAWKGFRTWMPIKS